MTHTSKTELALQKSLRTTQTSMAHIDETYLPYLGSVKDLDIVIVEYPSPYGLPKYRLRALKGRKQYVRISSPYDDLTAAKNAATIMAEAMRKATATEPYMAPRAKHPITGQTYQPLRSKAKQSNPPKTAAKPNIVLPS